MFKLKYILIPSVVLVLIILINRFSKKGSGKEILMKEPKNFIRIERTGDLDNDIVSFIQKKEGGLTDNPNDSASVYPVGKTFTYKGKTTDKWHTNKGITWQTFSGYANKLGYTATPELFYSMPNNVWLKIYREIYYKPFANFTDSKLINYYLSLWAWGSGVGGAKSLIKYIEKNGVLINDSIKKIGEKETLKLLILERIKFYERLAEKNPKNKVFLNGWTDGALSFWKNFVQ